jgi:hypothetical protein
MGRPIKKKFFGSDNVNDGLTYTGPGGEGLASITYTNRGSQYSSGVTATVAVSPIGGTRATISSVAVHAGNGVIQTATIGEAGTGYTTAPVITLVKPANVVVTGTNAAFWQDGSNIRLSSTTGLFTGMYANIAGSTTIRIATIYTDGNIRGASNYGNISNGTVITFGDTGVNGSLTAVLAASTVTANTIQANAWITGGTIGKQADIVAQKSSRRYRVTNADGTNVVRLVPTGVNGVNSPTVAQVISAGGPTTAGEMTLLATDSAGGVYLVGKLESRTALLFPAAIGGSAGTQFAANSHAVWTSTGVAVNGVSVKLATND